LAAHKLKTMKNIFYILSMLLITFGCSSDSNNDSTSEALDNNGQGGSLAKFTIVGDYLYTVDDVDMNVFNITNASNPIQVNTVPIGFGIETLFQYKEFLYIGSQAGMYIYSIADREFPTYLSDVQHFTACDPVVANSTTAFVTLWSDLGCGNMVNQLEVYDVTDIETPILLSTRQLVFPKGLGLYGDYLFVCDDEIKVFDISDPNNTVLVHSIDRLAFDVIIRDNLLIAVGEKGIYQYSLDPNDIENTEPLSTINI